MRRGRSGDARGTGEGRALRRKVACRKVQIDWRLRDAACRSLGSFGASSRWVRSAPAVGARVRFVAAPGSFRAAGTGRKTRRRRPGVTSGSFRAAARVRFARGLGFVSRGVEGRQTRRGMPSVTSGSFRAERRWCSCSQPHESARPRPPDSGRAGSFRAGAHQGALAAARVRFAPKVEGAAGASRGSILGACGNLGDGALPCIIERRGPGYHTSFASAGNNLGARGVRTSRPGGPWRRGRRRRRGG